MLRALLLLGIMAYAVASSVRAASSRGCGAAGAAVRLVGTLVIPATALALFGLFSWPLMTVAITLGAWLQSARAKGRVGELARHHWARLSPVVKAALTLYGLFVALRFASAASSPPSDGDSVFYHLPMSAAYLHARSLAPSQVTRHPAASELLEGYAIGTFGSVGGQAVIEGVILIGLWLASYGFAREKGATPDLATTASLAIGTIPMVRSQMFTSQNDLLVGLLLLAAIALWRKRPWLCALALGLALGTKYTGLVLGLAVGLVMLFEQGWPFPAASVLAGAAMALPWYVRNYLEAGSPFYLGSQTTGWSSTLASHLGQTWLPALKAMGYYGGSQSILGVVAVAALARSRKPLARLAFLSSAALLIAWSFIPNGAESVPGTLNQILSGWSSRYVLLLFFILAAASTLWIGERGASWGVLLLCMLSLWQTLVAKDSQTWMLWSSAPSLAALALLAVWMRGRRRSPWIATGILVLFSATMALGSRRVAETWNEVYASCLSPRPPTTFLYDERLTEARRVGVANLVALPFAGPHLERQAYYVDLNGHTPLSPYLSPTELENRRIELLMVGREAGAVPAPVLPHSPSFRLIHADPLLFVYRWAGGNAPSPAESRVP